MSTVAPLLLPVGPRPPEPEPGAEPSPPAPESPSGPPPEPESSPEPEPAPGPPPPDRPDDTTPGTGNGNGGGDGGGGVSDVEVPEELADCGALEVSCHVSNWFYDLVTAAVDPLMAWLGTRAFHTPEPTGGVESLWAGVLQATTVLYLLAILAGGVAVLSHESLQQRYSAREILPRLVIGFVAAHASLWIATEMIRGANGISAGISALGIDAERAATRFQQRLGVVVADATVFVILLLVAVVVLLVVWCVMEAVRIAMTVTLVVAAPLLLAFHALPYTQRLAALWWRAMAGVLAMPIAQSLAFSTFMRVLFQGEIFVVEGGAEDGWLLNIAVFLTVLYIQVRAPFWILRLVWRDNVGSSPLAAAVRTAVTALVVRKVLPGGRRGASPPSSSGSGGGGAAAAARGGPRRGPSAGGAAARLSGSGGRGPNPRRPASSSRPSPSSSASPSPRNAGGRQEAARPAGTEAAPGAQPRPAPGSRRTSGTRPSGSTGGEPGPPTRPNGGAMASPEPAPTGQDNSGSQGVQLPLFARPRRWRQGVLPTPPPTRVPGRRATRRQGQAPPAEEPPQPGPGQQALFPAPTPRPAPTARPRRPRVVEPPPAPRGSRRRMTQRWGDVAPDPPEQQPARPGRGQIPLFSAPRPRTAARGRPHTTETPQPARRTTSEQGTQHPRPQAPRRRNPRTEDEA